LRLTIENAEEYKQLIAKSLRNWDAERVAYMDQIILLVAISEIVNFNDIALEVSMNEYIELSKEYSSDKSYQFINGVLNNVVKELKQNNILFKAIKK
jgi:N utilization substance protein B